MDIGNRVFVPTDAHGYVEAEVVNKDKNMIKVQYVDKFIQDTYGNEPVIYSGEDLEQVRPKYLEEVRPKYWMMLNHKKFPDWVTKQFSKYNSCERRKEESGLFLYQRFVRDYLGHTSPYRGLLMYHTLGSGKTASAVTIAENLKDTRNILVLLPASLKPNFIEGIKQFGNPMYQTNEKLLYNKYSFVSYNSSNVIQQLDKIGSLDNKVIIIEEAHNLCSLIVNAMRMKKQGYEIYKRLLSSKNTKIVALTGTPVINTPFELAILFNMLRGYLEVIYFKIIRMVDVQDNFVEKTMEDDRVGYVEVNPLNRTVMAILKVHSWDMEFEQTIHFVEDIAKEYQMTLEFQRTDMYTLFPEQEEKFYHIFVKNEEMNNKRMFQRRIIGLVSYYEGKKQGYPELLPTKFVRIPMSEHQFELYEMARGKEREQERKQLVRTKLKEEEDRVHTLARVFSREFSNFVFPSTIVRPFKMFTFIVQSRKQKIIEELKARIKKGEITQEEFRKIMEEQEKGVEEEKVESEIQKAIEKVSTKQYLKDNLERYSPKMKAMVEEINKEEEGLILVYSTFRTLEGLEIFSKVLEFHTYAQYPKGKDYKRYAFFSGKEDAKEREQVIRIFTSSENKLGKLLRILLISSAGAEGLDLKNIQKVLIMEPYWHEIRIKQIIGRAVRKNSHKDLPKQLQKVRVYRYLAVFTDKQKQQTKDKLSTDEYILQLAKRKEALNVAFLTAIQQASVDCILNQCDNNIKCFRFTQKQGLSFQPDIQKNISYDIQEEQEVARKMFLATLAEDNTLVYKKRKDGEWYTADNNIYKNPVKVTQKYIFDPNNMKVYDFEIYKKTNELIYIGYVKENKLVMI